MKTNDLNKVYGIIGGSLKHTLSPSIFKYLFDRKKMNRSYTTFEIDSSSLKTAIDGIRILGVGGVNVTFPFKQKVIKYLDKIDASANNTGAVNTIKNTRSVLTGYNTDLFGIQKALSDRLKFNPRGKNIIILGAGGAARACIHALLSNKPNSIQILNRNPGNAARLLKSTKNNFGSTRDIIKSISNIRSINSDYKADIIINATSAHKDYVKKILDAMSRRGILINTTFFDLNYGDRAISGQMPTGIVKSDDGLYMLAAQAAKSFQIWTGNNIPTRGIFNFLNRKLKRIK